MSAREAPDWIASWLDGRDTFAGTTVAALTAFGDDARRLGFTPAMVGSHDDPVLALVLPADGRWPAHSWEIHLGAYDAERDGDLAEWLVDNLGNQARMGPGWVTANLQPSADGVVHIAVEPYPDE
jgi:hypothetical protein